MAQQGTQNPTPKKDWSWLQFVALASGLGLVLGAFTLIGRVGQTANLQSRLGWVLFGWLLSAVFIVTGIFLIVLGLVLLKPLKARVRELQWVEGLFLFFVLVIAANIPLLLIPPILQGEADAPKVEVPIPADKLVGGVEGLTAGRPVEVVVLAPDNKGTPVPQLFTDLEVRAFLGGETSGAVLVGVSADQAEQLQEAILDKESRFGYRLLPGTPTATPSPTLTPEPEKTATPGDNDSIFVEIPVDKIKPRVDTLRTGEKARMVIVTKRVAPTSPPESAVTVYETELFCVTVVTLLDGDGNRQGGYDKNTKKVLVELKEAKLASYGQSMAAAEAIWLVNFNCDG